MSPSNFIHGSEVTKGVIHAPSPTPLKISKDSHGIQKPNLERNNSSTHAKINQNPLTKRKPVIIYTHSPKIIHAKASDFMALVQKLTGLDRSEHEKTTMGSETESTGIKDEGSFSEEKDVKNSMGFEENESSSVLTDEKYVDEVKLQDSSAVSPICRVPNQYITEVPLFTPNSSEFFFSSKPNSFYPYPNNNSAWPSYKDYMKGSSEY